jgi:8-oxo-dGTP diphosphatase
MTKPSRGVVVAAVIKKDGKILACQRKKGDRHELKWEFPGGKLEFGENPREALERELIEELGIDAAIGNEIARYEFAYPNKTPIQLIFFEVNQYSGEIQNRIFAQLRWCDPLELPTMDFLEGDVDFVRRLAGRKRNLRAPEGSLSS